MNQDKVGKFLASLRKENNLTQEDIAEKLNVNVKSVSRWENGRNLPDPSIMKEICKIYNVSINELFNGEKVKKSNKVRQIFLFYIIVSLTGIFILPTLGIIAPTFIISAILCPIFVLVKLIGYIFKSEKYFEGIINNVKKNIDSSNTIIGSFMCQGKMPLSVRERYEKMREQNNISLNIDKLIANFDKALLHPNADDLKTLEQIVILYEEE